MKKMIHFLAAALFFLFAASNSFGQCPGCIIDVTCNPPGGGLCPDSLPAGTQGVPYDEDVTCYLPSTIDAGPLSGGVLGIVPLVSLHIDAISGLPFGLNWTCDHPGNNFAPSSGDTLGCVKICGIPISAPGVYNIVVLVTAGVDAGALGIQYGQTSFNFQMVLLPSTSGNIAFSYSPISACDSGTFAFTPNITGSLPQVVGYYWDFGGGNTSSVTTTTPIYVDFNTPGDYPVTLTTNIYALTLVSLNTTATPGSGDAWWTGDIEETCLISCPDPDLYFKFTHGSTTYISSSGSDNITNNWSSLNVVLTGNTIALAIWDEDTGPPFGSADDDGGTYVVSIPGPGVYGYTTTSPIPGYTGGAGGSFIISLVTDTVITVTDTIHVYPSPPLPSISSSSLDFCPGDSVLLTATPGYSYQWFLDDTILVASTSINQLYVNQPGVYSVTVYDTVTACSSHNGSVTITLNPTIFWLFDIVWDAPNQWLESNIGGTISYQWQTWNGSSWVNIPAPEGAQSYYTPTGNGEFQLIAMNTFGCSDTAYYNLNNFGLEDQNYISQVSIYPNPTNHSFTLDLKDIKGEELTISIVNMIGQTIYQKNFEINGGNFIQTFDVYEYASGIYTVDIQVGNFVIRKKLIKD